MSEKDGGPVHPSEYSLRTNQGITLRDYFASSAMAGYVMGWPLQTDAPIENLPVIAKMSYKIADAMIAERAK
jgi:hypothetical protein